MNCELLHTGLIAQDATLGLFRRRVNRQHCQLASVILQQMHAKRINAGGLTCSRHTADADSDRVSRIWKAFLDHFLSDGLMFGQDALNQSNSLTQHADVPFQNTINIFGRSE